MKKYLLLMTIVATLTIATACHEKRPMESPVPQTGAQVYVGLASFYGTEFAGNTTASGSSYDPAGFTGAHRSLPFGTKVMVTNLENNLTVIVTITDRGPQRADRVIDLSFAAAGELKMIEAGVVKVRVEVLNE